MDLRSNCKTQGRRVSPAWEGSNKMGSSFRACPWRSFIFLFILLSVIPLIACSSSDDDDDSSSGDVADDDAEGDDQKDDDDVTDDDDPSGDDDDFDNDPEYWLPPNDTQVLIAMDWPRHSDHSNRQAVIYRPTDPFPHKNKASLPEGYGLPDIEVCPLGNPHSFPVVLGSYALDTKIRCDENGTLYGTYIDLNRKWLILAEDSTGDWTYTDIFDLSGMWGFPLLPTYNITLDENGKFHIAVGGNQGLYYLTNASGQWTNELVQTGVIVVWEIEVGSDGGIHLLATDHVQPFSEANLNYHDNLAGTWETSTIRADSSSALGGEQTSRATLELALDDTAVVYYDYLDWFQVGLDSSCDSYSYRWTKGSSGGNHESMPLLAALPMLKIDPDGQETLAYGTDVCVAAMNHAPTPVGFAQRTGVEQWNTELVMDEIGWYPDMAIDDAGHIYIAYFDEDENLRYAHNRSGSWQVITVSADISKKGDLQ